MIDLLLKDATVITMDGKRRILENGFVVIDKGKILEVGNEEERLEQYRAHKVITCKGNLVMPGLVNGHSHAGHAMVGRLSCDMMSQWWETTNRIYRHYSDDEFWYLDGMLKGVAQIRSGMTTSMSILGNAPMSDEPSLAYSHADGNAVTGMRLILGVGAVCGPYPSEFTRWRDGKLVRHTVSVEEMLDGAEEIIRTYNHHHDDLTRVHIVPHQLLLHATPGTSDPVELAFISKKDRAVNRRVREIARKYNTRINTDAYGSWIKTAYQDKENMLLGPDVLIGMEHTLGITFEDIEILAETGTFLYYTAEGHYKRAPLSEIIERGVTCCIIHNSPAPRTMIDLLECVRRSITHEVMFNADGAFLQAGKALEMITIDAARCLGWDDEIGSLEAGKKADVIILDWNQPHLLPKVMPVHKVIYYAVGRDVKTVICNGKILMEDGIIKTVDEKALFQAVNEKMDHYLEKTGNFDAVNRVVWGKTRIEVGEDDPIFMRPSNSRYL